MNMKTISRNDFVKETGLKLPDVNRLVKEEKIKTHGNMIVADEVERVNEIMKHVPSAKDYVSQLRVDTLFDNDEDLLLEFLENIGANDIVILAENVDFAYESKSCVYINASKVSQDVKRKLIIWLEGFNQSYEKKREILLKSLKQRYPIFVNAYTSFLESREGETFSAYESLYVIDVLQDVTSKDVPGWGKKELSTYAENMYSCIKTSWKIWNAFQLYLKDKGYLQANPILMKVNEANTPQDKSGYSQEQFALIMQYCLNNASIQHNNLITKALENEKYASLWLYVALHFVSAWRKNDYKRIDTPHTKLSGDQIKALWELEEDSGTFAGIAMELETYIANAHMQPSKTKKYNPPDLKLYVGQSVRSTLGLIVAIAATHNTKKLIPSVDFTLSDYHHFFGSEMTAVLGGKKFANTKANKAILTAVMLEGDSNNSVNSGYVLAGLLRSHISAYRDIPASTKYYLKSLETESISIEFIVSQLFERGICNFAVLKFLELILGKTEMDALNFGKTTELVVAANLDAYQVEKLISKKNEAEAYATELIQMAHEQGQSPLLILKRLAFGKARSLDGGYCYAKAITGKCLCDDRQYCLHCTYEALTISMLNKLITEREQAKSRLDTLPANASPLAIAKEKAVIEMANEDILEIIEAVELFSEEEFVDKIAHLVERRIT